MANAVFTISSLLVGLTGIVLIAILLKYGSKKIHYILALFNFFASIIWGFGAFLVGISQTDSIAIISWKIALLGGVFAPIVFYHVIAVLGELKKKILIVIF